MRVASMTIGLNEALLGPGCLASLLDSNIDLCIYIDTGSTDNTLKFIYELFSYDIAIGRLVVHELQCFGDMYIARNLALEIMRNANIDYFIKADCDEIFYTDALNDLIKFASEQPANSISELHTYKYELYQDRVIGNTLWVQSIIGEYSTTVFFDRDMTSLNAPRGPFGHPTLRPVKGAFALGKWTDEAAKKLAEGIYYKWDGLTINSRPQQGKYIEYGKFVMAHYGWAKPIINKINKEREWAEVSPVVRDNKRICNLHDTLEGPFLKPFDNHPEALVETLKKTHNELIG